MVGQGRPAALLQVIVSASTGKANAELARFSGQMKATAASAEGSAAASAAAWDKTGAKMQAVGKKMTTHLSLPAVAVGAAAVKMSMDFSHAMEQIHTQAGASAGEVESLSKQVKDFAASGHSTHGPEDLANSLFHIESAGFRAGKAMKVLKASEALATTGASDMETTTNALVGAMRSGIKGAGNMHQAIGTLNATVGAGNMRMDDLTAAMGTGFLTNAKQMGLTLGQAGAALATLTRQGQPATASATRLSMAFRMMMSPTNSAASALKSVGLSATKLGTMMQAGNFPQAIALLSKHLDALGGSPEGLQKKATIIKDVFGARSSTGINAILQGLDQYNSALDQVNQKSSDFANLHGAAMETETAKLHALWAKLQVTLIDTGTALLPVVNDLADVIAKMAGEFSKMPKFSRDLLLGAIVLGPLIRMVGVLVQIRAGWLGIQAAAAAASAAEAGAAATGGAGAAAGAGEGIAMAPFGAAMGGGAAATAGGVGLGTIFGVAFAGAVAVAIHRELLSKMHDSGAGGALGSILGTAGDVQSFVNDHLGGLGNPVGQASGIIDNLFGHHDSDAQKKLADLTDRMAHSHGLISAQMEKEVRRQAMLVQQAGDITKEQRHQIDLQAAHKSGGAADRMMGGQRGAAFVKDMLNPATIRRQMDAYGVSFDQGMEKLAQIGVLRLKELPAGARQEAANTMIVMAQQLAQKGKLPEAQVQALVKSISRAFPKMKVVGANAAKSLVQVVNTSLARFDTNTPAKKFDQLMSRVQKSMQSGALSVKQGTALINSIMKQEFAALGMPDEFGAAPSHKAVIQHQNPTRTGGKDPALGKHQRGAAMVPGAGVGDKYPVRALLEPGEIFGVFNKNAAPYVNAMNAAFPRFAKGGVQLPSFSGNGAIGSVGAAALNKEAAAAEVFLKKHAPKGKGGGPNAAGGPSGTTNYMGVTMAIWVAKALKYAAAHGSGNPQPTSGFRPGFDPHAPSGSQHALTRYPGGAVDFGGMVDPAARPKKMAVVNATRGFRFPLLAPIGFRDDGHASGTGHQRGGVLHAQKGLVFPPNTEGPEWYGKAYKLYGPFAKPGPYKTMLGQQGEAKFEEWAHRAARAGHIQIPLHGKSDYDYRGFWKSGAPWHPGTHFPDTFKTPYDTTFSRQSKYASANNPFDWKGNQLVDTRSGRVITKSFADGGVVHRMVNGGIVDAWASELAQYKAPKPAAVSLYAAGLAESNIEDLPGGDASSEGALQLLASTARGMGISPHNSAAIADAFLTKGYYGKGGAISLARKHMGPAAIAHAVQGNATGSGVYASKLHQALSILHGTGLKYKNGFDFASFGKTAGGKGKSKPAPQLPKWAQAAQAEITKLIEFADHASELGGTFNGRDEVAWATEALQKLWALRNALVKRYVELAKQIAAATAPSGKLKPIHSKQEDSLPKHKTDALRKAGWDYNGKLHAWVPPASNPNLAKKLQGQLSPFTSALTDIQGAYAPMKVIPNLPAVGVLPIGGQIFDLQSRLKQAGANTTASGNTSLSVDQLKELTYLSTLGVKFNPSQFSGFFAKGGILGAGQWGIAGENGPEPVIGPAAILSNRGGGGTMRVVLEDNRTAVYHDGELVREVIHDELDKRGRKQRGAPLAKPRA